MILKDKIVVITGGSQGFGKALAKFFVAETAKVVISSDNDKLLQETAEELQCDSFKADVTSYLDLQSLAKYVIKKHGRIDVWINNAGIQIAPSLVENIDIKKLHRLFDINFFGYFYGCQIAIEEMKKKDGGIIININSTAGLEGKPDISAYSASKFAIKGLTESIRRELQSSNIKIFGVFPGGMRTDIYKEKYPDNLNEYMDVEQVAEKVVNNLKSDTPEIDLIIKRPAK